MFEIRFKLAQIVKILVEVGQVVKQGDALLILSSMKMENIITAEKNGTVMEIFVIEEQNIEAGFLLLRME